MSRRRRLRRVVIVAAAALAAACDGPSSPTFDRRADDPPPFDTPPPTNPSTTVDPGTGAGDAARAMCAPSAVEATGSVASAALVEASGLAASRTHAGVLWSHNDGEMATAFAVGSDGADLGAFAVPVAGTLDVEDIALIGEPGAGRLLLADIGDNDARRDEIRVLVFDEPDPAAPSPVVDVETLRFRYPDRPHNAESLLVDERNGVIVIVTKEQAARGPDDADAVGRTRPSFVFEGPLDGHTGDPVELTLVGMLDVVALEQRTSATIPHPASVLGFGGLPTGADVSPDGSLIALRTYEAVWLWPRRPGQRVSDVLITLDEFPCRVTSSPEPQGEAVAFVDGGLVTVSEGQHRPLHRTAR